MSAHPMKSTTEVSVEALVNFAPEALHRHGLCSCPPDEDTYACTNGTSDRRWRAAFAETLDHIREAEGADQRAL